MAEVLGAVASALTLAGLFKLCIQAFDFVHVAKNQSVDIEKLTLKLNIEKCRLWTWGQAIGLNRSLRPGPSRPLEDSPVPIIAEQTLHCIVNLLNNAETLRQKYGCRELQPSENQPLLLVETDGPRPLEWLSRSFNHFKVHNGSKVRREGLVKKGSWVVYDRKKFTLLISEVKEFIDGLQNITKDVASLASQDRAIRSRITTIDDEETLDMVADICEVTYPSLSDAASVKADAITLSTNLKGDIYNWADDVTQGDSDEAETLDDLESLTTTELKHKIFSLIPVEKELMQLSEHVAALYPSKDVKKQDDVAHEQQGQRRFAVDDIRRRIDIIDNENKEQSMEIDRLLRLLEKALEAERRFEELIEKYKGHYGWSERTLTPPK